MIELVEDTLLAGGLRKMRWMSEAPIPVPSPISDEIGEGGCRRWGDEKLGVHYLEVVYPYRGPVYAGGRGGVRQFGGTLAA